MKKPKPAKGKTPAVARPAALTVQPEIIPPQKRGGGRPSSFDQAVADELCQRVAVREPLHKVCADPRMPCEVTVYKWRQQFPEFAKKYARAREARAESRADRIDQYIDDVKAGTLDPNQARVMIDAEKWQSSKEQPKRFGDRVELDTPADGGIAKAVAVSQVAIAALIAKGRQQ
jgi:hypothetical protein